VFRNRITDALRWSEENSDAAIERELAEIEAAPLRDDEVSRILTKTAAIRAERHDLAEQDHVPSPLAGEKGQTVASPAETASTRTFSNAVPEIAARQEPRPPGLHGDADMKTTNRNVRLASGQSKPSGSSLVLAIVTSCACLLAALGLFQATVVDDSQPGSGTETAAGDASHLSLVAAVANADSSRFAYPTRLVPQRREAAPVERVKVGDVITTGERERKRLLLPDGSVLFVNQQTVAKVETPRKVRVEVGEVYVEVVPENLLAGELRTKFVVEAPDRSVTALGTKFAVKAAPKRETEVLVTQGEVTATGLETSIKSGRQLVALDDALALAIPESEAERRTGTLARPGAEDNQNRTGRSAHPTDVLARAADGLVVQQAPRASEALSWTRELMAEVIPPIVPASKHRGGSLIVIDTEGQEMRLSLRKFHIDVHIEDGFARTTIDQTYFNHTQSRQEGTFHFPLPPDASLSRLAMYVNGKLMEGGMAERDHARNTFEEIVRSMKDPALLEWVDGSTFKMRVFPLEPRQEKRIVMSYSQRLSNDYGKEVYRFPAGHNLDRVRDWSTQVRVAGGANLQWDSPSHFLKGKKSDGDLLLEGEAQKVTMNDDLVVELVDPAQKRVRSSTRFSTAEHEGQQYLMLRMRPDLGDRRTDALIRQSPRGTRSALTDEGVRPTGPQARNANSRRPKRNWVFLYESSGDRDPILARVQVDVIRTFLDNAEHDDTFSIVRASSKAERFSVRPVPCVKKQITKAVDFMEDSHLLGALDLKQAFKMCGKLTSDDAENWLVHVGSGIPAIGERDASSLERQLPKNARYVGVGIGKRWNRPFMKTAAGRTGGHFAQINPDEKIGWRAFELFSTLNAPRLLDVKVAASGDEGDLRFLNFADTLAHGQELCAVTRLSNETKLPKSLVVTGLLNGKEFRQTVKVKKVAKNADYLPRSWSRLEIDRLVALGATEHKDTIISLSKAMYVMSPFTSLLVLENEEMYKKYNIDRGRKDHWALYGAPPQIKVVHEPLMGPRPNASPEERAKQLRLARAESDEAKTNVDLAQRDQRDKGIIEDLYDQVELREAQVEVLSRQVETFEKTETDELAKLADTVAWRKPHQSGQWIAVGNDYGLGIPVEENFVRLAGPQDHWRYTTTLRLNEPKRRLAQLNRLNSRPYFLKVFGQPQSEISDVGDVADRIARYDLAYRMEEDFLRVNPNGVTRFARPDLRSLSELNRPLGIVSDAGIQILDGFTNGTTPYDIQLRTNLELVSQLYSIPQGVNPRFGPIGSEVGYRPFTVDGRRFAYVDFDDDVVTSGFNQSGLTGIVVMTDGNANTLWMAEDFARQNLGRGGQIFTTRLGDFDTDGDRLPRFATTLPELASGIRSDVSVEELESLGAVIIRDNQVDVDKLATFFYRIEQLQESQSRLTSIRLTTPQQSQLHLGQGLVDLSRRRLGGQVFERGVGRININTLRNPQLLTEFIDDYGISPYFLLRPPGLLPDLTELMPGLQTQTADQLAVLEAEGGEKVKVRRGSIDDKARKLIERARKTGWQKVVVKSLLENGQPVTVSINGSGKFRYDRTLPYGVRETVICDGKSQWHIYAELGLAAKRPMSRFHRDAMSTLFPWAVDPEEDLSIGCDIRYVDENTIELVPLKPEKAETKTAAKDDAPKTDAPKKAKRKTLIVQLVFGKDGRLAEKRLVAGRKRELVMRTLFKADGTVRVLNSHDKELLTWKIERFDSAPVNLRPETKDLVVLPLPYRSKDHVQPLLKPNGAYSEMSEADALKVVAAWFASGDFGSLSALINARYIKQNDNRLGFLTLMSLWTPHNTAVQPIFQSRKDDPMASFLVHYYNWRNFGDANVEFPASDKLPKFAQNLAKAHNLFALWFSGRATKDRTRAQIESEVRKAIHTIRECRQAGIRWKLLETVQQKVVEAGQFEGELGLSLASEAKRFEELPVWKDSARFRNLIWLLQARKTKGTAKRYRDLLVEAAESGGPIILSDEIHKLFKQRLKGHREWTSAVNAVAKILKKNRGPASLIHLAEQCRSLEEKELADSLYMKALIDVKLEADSRLLPQVYNYERRGENWKKADEHLRLLLKNKQLTQHPAIWREAAVVSTGLGDHDEALRRLEHALNLEFQNLPETVDLKPFRTTYGELFDKFALLAESRLASEKALPKDFLDRLLAMADRWRTIDPDDTDVCGRVARIAAKLGEADIAWGYWTTPLAENPGDSGAWRNLGKEMGAQSNTQLASRAFDQAFEIESTNPEILYEQAMMLRSAGEEDAAKKKLGEIVNGKWGRKFNGTRSKAGKALQQTP
jgi:tetratricopeptide (TPR) repeat protein